MYFTYGNFKHERKDVEVQVTPTIISTPRGEPYAVKYSVDLKGSIFGSGQSQLISNVSKLLAAYNKQNQDFALYFNDGTPTPDIAIKNKDTIGGVNVVRPPAMDARSPSQWSSYWDYSIGLEATVRLEAATSRTIWEFDESIEMIGTGGPKTAWVELKRSRAQKQQPREFTLCRATQRGTIVGLNRYLDDMIPPARWPDLCDQESVRVVTLHPKNVSGTFVEYGLEYSYQFTSNGPFPGSRIPTIR